MFSSSNFSVQCTEKFISVTIYTEKVSWETGRGGASLVPCWDHDHSALFWWDPDPSAQKTGGISWDWGKNTWIPAQIPATKHCENTMKTT